MRHDWERMARESDAFFGGAGARTGRVWARRARLARVGEFGGHSARLSITCGFGLACIGVDFVRNEDGVKRWNLA